MTLLFRPCCFYSRQQHLHLPRTFLPVQRAFSTQPFFGRAKNEAIQSASGQIYLINAQGEAVGLCRLEDQLAQHDHRTRFQLIHVADRESVPVCKWIPLDATARRTNDKPKSPPFGVLKLKEIQVKETIGSNDLQIRLRKMQELLLRGHALKITTRSARQKFFLYKQQEQSSELRLLESIQSRLTSSTGEYGCAAKVAVAIHGTGAQRREASMTLHPTPMTLQIKAKLLPTLGREKEEEKQKVKEKESTEL